MIPRRTGKAFALAFLLALPALAAAEVELSATADATEIALDGTVTLRISATYASKAETGDLVVPELALSIVARAKN